MQRDGSEDVQTKSKIYVLFVFSWIITWYLKYIYTLLFGGKVGSEE